MPQSLPKADQFTKNSKRRRIWLGVSYSYANKVVKALNAELAEKGFMVVTGKVSRKFFEERFYGMNTTANQQKGEQ